MKGTRSGVLSCSTELDDVSIRQQSSAYVSIRQQSGVLQLISIRQQSGVLSCSTELADVSIRQHASPYVSGLVCSAAAGCGASVPG
jgi:hypothetical protein